MYYLAPLCFAKGKYKTIIEIVTANQVPGITANQNSLDIRTGADSFSSPVPPLILIDGIETNWTSITRIPATDIQTINVFRRTTELAAYQEEFTGFEHEEGKI